MYASREIGKKPSRFSLRPHLKVIGDKRSAMKQLSLSLENAHIPDSELKKAYDFITPFSAQIQKVVTQGGYTAPESSLNLPFDENCVKKAIHLTTQKECLEVTGMVVVGIGGSNLGTMAVYQALYGSLGNPDFPLWWADTVDTDQIALLLNMVESRLKKGEKLLLSLISKSGTTTETVANGACFLEIFKKCFPTDYHQYIVVITDKDSVLWKLAAQERFDCLEIPVTVGGRYSVMSAVGLFPLACAGVNIAQLQLGAKDIVMESLDAQSEACRSAIVIAHYYARGYVIHDLFIFDAGLEAFGKWYRQLMGESIGKEKNLHGKTVHGGITPTVSMGSTDLHSVGQLYLGGPFDKLTTFINVHDPMHAIKVPQNSLSKLVAHIEGKSLQQIMNAIVQGTQRAYAEHKRPFMSITLEQKNAYYMGQLLQLKMIQMMYLGALLEVNPFDQPNVELYKIQTRKILAHE